MAQAQFPEPKDLDVPLSQRIGDGTNYPTGQWSVSNPHPGYGKDPNILNEFGHTMYPKYVKDAEGKDVIVNSAEEEAKVSPKPEAKFDPDSGPTVEQWVEAGYKAADYPPAGYNSKSSKAEIDAAIAKQNEHAWK